MNTIVHWVKDHGSYWLPWHTLFLTIICAGLYILAGPAPEVLIFDRAAIGQGEYRRLFTGHWVHGDMQHLAWNLMAFVILGWLLERIRGPVVLYAALLGGALFVSVGVWQVPGLAYYCGLSGVLNTLMYMVLMDAWLKFEKRIFLFVLAGASIKIAYEMVFATAVFTDTAWPAVPEAHLAGALAGITFMSWPLTRKHVRQFDTTKQLG